MILGIGVDIIQNHRLSLLVNKESFLKRTFSDSEIASSRKILNRVNYFAKRFAAKEAFAKSLGTGFKNNLNFKDVEILNDKEGKPYFLKTKKIDKLVKNRFKIKEYDLLLSITDEKDYSIAFTILHTENV